MVYSSTTVKLQHRCFVISSFPNDKTSSFFILAEMLPKGIHLESNVIHIEPIGMFIQLLCLLCAIHCC